jgi:uridylate kinase
MVGHGGSVGPGVGGEVGVLVGVAVVGSVDVVVAAVVVVVVVVVVGGGSHFRESIKSPPEPISQKQSIGVSSLHVHNP